MRIIAGEWRSRRLVAPAGAATRPTSDRTRETLFSMLASRIGSFDGLRVADLYAGSGALGFEALSRSAATCLFVERDPAAQQAIRANAESLGCAERITIRPAFAPAEPFDVIFADPPYGGGEAERALAEVRRLGLLADGGWLALETARDDAVSTEGFALAADRQVGRARLMLLRSAPSQLS